ncbi:hypothetical protein RLIN73S_06716 [Rhodanobacter lindaniclasticus]
MQVGRQPLLERGQQVHVGHIGQAPLGQPRAQRLHARAQAARMLAPRQRIQPTRADRRQHRRQGIGRLHRHAVARQHDGAEAGFVECLGGAARIVPVQRALAAKLGGEVTFQHARVQRRGGEHQAVARLQPQVGHHQPRLAQQAGVLVQAHAATVAQGVAARIALVAMGDAVGEGVRQQVADGVAVGHAGGGRPDVQTSAPALAGLLDRGQRAGVDLAARGTAAAVAPGVQGSQAHAQIVVARLHAAQR